MIPEAYGPFAKPAMTVEEATASGFTHIEARCTCGRTSALPFALLVRERRAKPDTALTSIASRLRCERCGSVPAKWRPWRQYIDGAPGYAYGDHSRTPPAED